MKTIAETLGVARSNLYDRLEGPPTHVVAITGEAMPSYWRGLRDW
jgi:hypothetical protein